MTADEFNSAFPVGTPVIAYPFLRPDDPIVIAARKHRPLGRRAAPEDAELCKRLETRTRSAAWTLGHGAPVVMVDGYAGGIALTHIDVITEGAAA